jgi:hypothetical protein
LTLHTFIRYASESAFILHTVSDLHHPFGTFPP